MAVEEGHVLPGHALAFCGECRWLISLDYDETLRVCDAEHPVSDFFYELMRAWRPYGVRWGINTGRTLPYLCEELLPTAPFLPDFICTCERYAYMAQEDGVVRPLVQHNTKCHEHNMQVRTRIQPLLHAQLHTLRSIQPSLDWCIAPTDPLSVEAGDSSTMDIIMRFLEPFLQALDGVCAQRAGRYMRLADARYCKGTALQTVAAEWQVPPNRWAMIGDGHNDLHAFRLFPQAFCAAPANAHPEVLDWLRRHGGFISSSVGVIEILQAWFRMRMTER